MRASILCFVFLSSCLPIFSNEPEIEYTMPKEGNASLGIYDQDGKLFRWILKAEPREAGVNREKWDGLDQYGEVLPAGDYIVKGLHFPPLKYEYAATVGNPGTPPWPTQDGRGDWLSDEANPQAVATDGRWVFLGAPGSEKGHAIIAVDEKGQRIWGRDEPLYPRSIALAVDGDFLYAVFSGPQNRGGGKIEGRALIACIDTKTGRAAGFSTKTPRIEFHTWEYREEASHLSQHRRDGTFSPAVYAGQPRYACHDMGETDNVLGVAVRNGKIYTSCFYEDRLLVLDAETAEKIDEIFVPKPVGLTFREDGNLLVVSGESVVVVDPATKKVELLISKHLEAPFGITTDRKNRIFVSDWKKSHRVKVFDKDGEAIHAIGTKGGRPWFGPWKTDGMLLPREMAVTDDGKLWVAEDDSTPKRVSVWNAEGGKFVREFLGPAPYGGTAMFDLDRRDPSIAYSLGVKFKIDYETKKTTPLETVLRRMDPDDIFTPDGSEIMAHMTHHVLPDGNEVICVHGYHMIQLFRPNKSGRWIPFSAAGGIHRYSTDNGRGRRVWDSDIGGHVYKEFYPEFFTNHAGDNFSWFDVNGDGIVQADEMQWTPTLTRGDLYGDGTKQVEWLTPWGAAFSPEGPIFFTGFCRDRQVTYRLDPIPNEKEQFVYDIRKAKTIVEGPSDTLNGLYRTKKDDLMLVGNFRFYDHRGKDALSCYTTDGKLKWSLANAKMLRGDEFHAENFSGEFTVPGIGTVLGSYLWHGSGQAFLITDDGLFISAIQDLDRFRQESPFAVWDESYRSYHQGNDGTCWFMNGANDSHHLFKVVGLDRGGRFETALKITEADEEFARKRLETAKNTPPPPPRPMLGVVWREIPPTIDGDLSDWNLSDGNFVEAGLKRAFRSVLSRDKENLYLAFEVKDETPLSNPGENWQTLFISGDCVDLMIAADRDAIPVRTKAIPGDTRILFSTFQDNPIVVRYRSVVPGTKTPHRLMAAELDEIIRLDKVQVAMKRGADSYTVEATVPFAELGIDPNESLGKTYRGDVGVVFSDETGRGRSLRLYHYNKDTAMTADLTTEATLPPNRWGDLFMPLGRNLLKNGNFSDDFIDNPEEGWQNNTAREGMAVEITGPGQRTGQRALQFRQAETVRFPEGSAEAEQDYSKYIRSANDGRGGGFGEIRQHIPVEGGRKYHFRFYVRASDMMQEIKNPGPVRGYTSLGIRIEWNRGKKGTLGVLGCKDDFEEWKEYFDPKNNVWHVSTPYEAPEGATEATLIIGAGCNTDKHLPVIVLDDLEFVEIPSL